MQLADKRSKLNNAGFTLVEVIVAAAIMALVTVPLLHALTTAVNTNARAKEKMRATNAAENIMEDLSSMIVKDAVKKYSNGGIDAPNIKGQSQNANNDLVAYEINLDENSIIPGVDSDLKKALDLGYKARITIDPSFFPNNNKINLSSINSVSSDTAAIYNMSPNLDNSVCDKFSEFNNAYKVLDNNVKPKTSADFNKLLKREIRIDIEKKDTFVDEDGNTQDAVNVFLTVSYLLTSGDNNPEIVQNMNRMYVADSRLLFDNTSTKQPLSAIFIMYYPRTSTKDGDIIIIHNHDNVEANLYVAAQTYNEDYLKKKDNSLILQMYQSEVADEDRGGTKQPLTLRTNLLLEDADYAKKDDSKQLVVQSRIHLGKPGTDPEGKDTEFDDTTYNTIVKKRNGKFADKDVAKELNAQNLAGKTLNAADIDSRIYKLSVVVYKGDMDANGKITETEAWPVKVELTGSILE